MMSDHVREFHETFDVPSEDDVVHKRLVFHEEEAEELTDALKRLAWREPQRAPRPFLEAVAHELADCVYVAYGTADLLGLNLDVALAEVHRANMSKRGPDGKVMRRDDGKILKGPGYVEPDMSGTL